jgi:protease I
MADQALAGKKIAVVVESQYIPAEIKCYQERFASYGAQVHLLSRLWGQPSARFYSTVEPGVVDQLEWLEVTRDFDEVDLGEYGAVVVAANYTSVRLRWNEAAITASDPALAVQDAPAVRFLRRAMRNPAIVKALPCHALWLLMPCPELLAGRQVTCNPCVLADVLNAGGTFVPPPAGADWQTHIVIDRDLVTTCSARAAPVLVDVVRDLVNVAAIGTSGLASPLPDHARQPIREQNLRWG